MDTEHEATLATLQDEFPAFHITLEAAVTGPRYIARSRHLSQNPHTVVTRDPAELRATLTITRPSEPRPVLPRRRLA